MGLPNSNDWRYHQKPGNLFNTYLGKAPPPERSSTQRRRRDRRPPVRLTPPEPKDPIEALVDFLQYNASVGDANQFLRLTAKREGLEIRPSKQPWEPIREFAEAHLTSDQVERYLAEFRRRKAAGEPLIQAPPRR